MPTDTFASFNARVDKLGSSLKDPQLRKLMTEIGVEAKKLATKAASADLGGDPKFSGRAPTLDTKFDHVGAGRISFHPTGKSAGPWTVAEFGRNQTAGPKPLVKLTKGGKVSKAKGKRWNGRTKGKGTATDALKAIDPMVMKKTNKHVETSIAKFFHS
jgi:hypothetical protein